MATSTTSPAFIAGTIVLTLSMAVISCGGPAPETTTEPQAPADSAVVSVPDSLGPALGYGSPCLDQLPEVIGRTGLGFDFSMNKLKFRADERVYSFDASDRIRNDSLMHIAEAAGVGAWFWQKRTLKVSFLRGDTVVQRRIRNTARKWERVCAVRFDFGAYAQPDIAIALDTGVGTWSAMGVNSLVRRPGQASMNYDDLQPTTLQRWYDYYVLHEFGHALGLIHEHQSPVAGIQWDSAAVYAHFLPPNGKWDSTMVQDNIFFRYAFDEVNCTAYDATSIMVYAIDSTWTLDRYHVEPTNRISPNDARFMALAFPNTGRVGLPGLVCR